MPVQPKAQRVVRLSLRFTPLLRLLIISKVNFQMITFGSPTTRPPIHSSLFYTICDYSVLPPCEIYLTKNKACAILKIRRIKIVINTKFTKIQKMNFTNLLSQLIALVSLLTACGVVLHDTSVDKAFSSAFYRTQKSDFTATTEVSARPANPHTHPQHLSVAKNQSAPRALPRERNKRFTSDKHPARGYHGENICLPFAGEWT